MRKYKTLLFDLDGTLTDPMLGITRSVQYALQKFEIQVNDLSELCSFIGPPLDESFKKYYSLSEQQTKEAIAHYRVYFSKTGIFENKPYPGIKELLRYLREEGFQLMVATSKPTCFAKQILAHFDLDKYFIFVGGSELDGTRSAKAEVISYVLQQNHITQLEEVVMIGDREHDIFGAKKVGIDSIGVLYGYGSSAELTNAGATYLVENVEGLKDYICL